MAIMCEVAFVCERRIAKHFRVSQYLAPAISGVSNGAAMRQEAMHSLIHDIQCHIPGHESVLFFVLDFRSQAL